MGMVPYGHKYKYNASSKIVLPIALIMLVSSNFCRMAVITTSILADKNCT
jgi:hypothetical protein